MTSRKRTPIAFITRPRQVRNVVELVVLHLDSIATTKTTDTATSISTSHLHPRDESGMDSSCNCNTLKSHGLYQSTFVVRVGRPTWASCIGLINRFPGYINTVMRDSSPLCSANKVLLRSSDSAFCYCRTQYQIYHLLDTRTFSRWILCQRASTNLPEDSRDLYL